MITYSKGRVIRLKAPEALVSSGNQGKLMWVLMAPKTVTPHILLENQNSQTKNASNCPINLNFKADNPALNTLRAK